MEGVQGSRSLDRGSHFFCHQTQSKTPHLVHDWPHGHAAKFTHLVCRHTIQANLVQESVGTQVNELFGLRSSLAVV